MLVKCMDLNGEKREKNTCYKAPDKKYYSSQEAYNKIIQEKDYRKKVGEIIHTLFGFDKHQIVSPYLWVKIKRDIGSYSFECIYDTIVDNYDFLEKYFRSMDFNGEQHMINFIVKIIANNINDVYNKKKRDVKIKSESDTSDIDLSIVDNLRKENTSKDVSSLVDDIWT